MAEDMGLQPGPGSGGLLEAFRNLGKFASIAASGVAELTQATIGATSSMDAAASSAEKATGKLNGMATAAKEAKSALGSSSYDASGNVTGAGGVVVGTSGGAVSRVNAPSTGGLSPANLEALLAEYRRLSGSGASMQDLIAALNKGLGR